jgi:hypothetical protein
MSAAILLLATDSDDSLGGTVQTRIKFIIGNSR